MATSMKAIRGLPSLSGRGQVSRSGVVGSRLRSGAVRRVTAMSGKGFDKDWLMASPMVNILGFFGWVVPSSTPVPAFDGNSLTGLFFAQIPMEWSHWPTGPALDSPFWLYMITWHIGLFTCLTLGQIGWNGRKQGYFQ
ncbi:hypothetical protein BSKO_03137 [Bryopsis sp. KO-2023]|nr:hypothetical protein BSKO_03137 [Bryopsis sp. KO-2023]